MSAPLNVMPALSGTGPPPNANNQTYGFKYKGHGNPNGLILGYEGDDYLDLDTGAEWQKLSDNDGKPSKTGWFVEAQSYSITSFEGADPTGVVASDDAFAAAFNTIPAGSVLNLGDGNTYLVSSLDVTRSDLTIVGHSIVKASSVTPNWLRITGDNITIDGPTFDGDNKVCNILQMGDYHQNWKLLRSTFKNAIANDTTLGGVNALGQANGFRFGKGVSGIVINGCTFQDIDKAEVIGNLHGRFCAGIYGSVSSPTSAADHFYDVRITENKFYRIGRGKTDGDGVRFQGYSTSIKNTGLIVNNNTFINCGERAAKFLISGYQFCGNWIQNDDLFSVVGKAMFAGVSCYGGYATISENIIIGGSIFRGIDISSNILGRVEKVQVSDNIIEFEPVYGFANSEGISLGSVLGVNLSNNSVANSKNGIVVFGDARRVNIYTTTSAGVPDSALSWLMNC